MSITKKSFIINFLFISSLIITSIFSYFRGNLDLMNIVVIFVALASYFYGFKKSFIYSTFKDGEHLNASLLMLKKGVFLTIGGFDPVFFMYAEDYDILRRALRIDIKLAICNSAQYHHAISHSYKLENVNSSFTQTKIRHYSRSRLIYALANPYTPFTVNLLRVIFVFLRGLREYISAPRLLRAFLISFFDVPWIKCYAKWRRDRLKNYQYYIDAIMVPKDVSLISKC